MKAIDMHVHVATGESALRREREVPLNKEGYSDHPDAMAEMYQELNMMAVIFDVDSETQGGPKIDNREVAEWVKKYPKTFIGFGSVDPWKGRLAIEEVQRCADMGLKGMKFHPALQAFCPADPRFFPLWEACARLDMAVLIHTGTTAAHAGKPGGGGLSLKYCRPIYVDEVAAKFPELRIIMAHPAWPWHDEQLAIAVHKANVYIDLSGWAPKYFPPSVVHYANTLLQDKVFFGSDFPFLTPHRWLREFADLPFKDSVRPKILLHNAARFLGLSLEYGQEASEQGPPDDTH